MRALPTTTCLAAIAATLVAWPAVAATTVSTSTTTPLATSSAGDVTVASGGTISVPSGAAITVDSSNAVSNAGSVSVAGADGASGITVNGGVSSTINNTSTGTISVTEDFIPNSTGGIATGPTASASNRYGIHVLSGGTLTGGIANDGKITVEGLNSGGIVLDAPLSGSLTNTGTIIATGDNSTAIKTGAVTGNVWIINGTVTAIGQGSTALAVNGDVGGTVNIEGTVQQLLSYTADNGESITLSRSNVNVGAPAAVVSGNVAGGVVVAIAPTASTSTTDANNNGVADSSEGSGSISSIGNGPALLIGGANPITISPVTSNTTGNASGYSVEIDGSLKASASYTSTNAFGLVIGGAGGTVNVPGGIGVTGTITATTIDSGATGVLINQGATVPTLTNSGTISATNTSAGQSSLYGIRDLSGTLTNVTNTGHITVGGTVGDLRNAIDLSSNTTGVTITQQISSANATTRTTAEQNGAVDSTVYDSIVGNIITGTGNDTLNVSDGTVTGDTYFNGGNDQLQLSGRAAYTGSIYFGQGVPTAALSGTSTLTGNIDFAGMAGTLTIADTARFTGSILNGGASTITVNGGTFGAGSATTFNVGTLTVNSGGALGVYINTSTGTSSRVIAHTATFASGAKVSATISSLSGAEGSYTILTADSLTSQATFDSSSTALPYIFAGSVTTSGNNLILDIRRKAADELGLRRAAAQGYEAIVTAAESDTKMTSDILGIFDAATLQTHLDALLPDHAGAVFDTVTRGSRLVSQHVMDADSTYDISNIGGWFEPVFWHASKDVTDTAAYNLSGWGLSMGLERVTGVGRFGISYAWLTSTIHDNGGTGRIKATQHEIGLFWRLAHGPFYAFVRGSGAPVSLSGNRSFTGDANGTSFTYANAAKWHGWLYSAAGGASYDADLSEVFSLRPMATFDYYHLHENGYAETGGGSAMDLTVLSRNSDVLTATTTLTGSYRFGPRAKDLRPLTLEIEGGRRNYISGDLGTTLASFAGGNVFAITPDQQKSAWIGEVRLLSGGMDFTWKLAARAERIAGNLDYSGRASLSLAF